MSLTTGKLHSDGIEMYYEILGKGDTLILIHGGGSTIETSFGNIRPLLAQKMTVVAIELQAHGRTPDRDTPLSFKQNAKDVARLIDHLGIKKCSLLGFSNGGQTLIQFALDYPEKIDRLILASTFYARSAAPEAFWNSFNTVSLDVMPLALRRGFLEVNNDSAALQQSFDRDVELMKNFKGWTDEEIESIEIPTMIMMANQDVAPIAEADKMHQKMQNSELIVLPGGHGGYLGTIETVDEKGWDQPFTADIILRFLQAR